MHVSLYKTKTFQRLYIERLNHKFLVFAALKDLDILGLLEQIMLQLKLRNSLECSSFGVTLHWKINANNKLNPHYTYSCLQHSVINDFSSLEHTTSSSFNTLKFDATQDV